MTTSPSNIPDEAVEAAARFIREASGAEPDRSYIRSVLEIAAPHMQDATKGERR